MDRLIDCFLAAGTPEVPAPGREAKNPVGVPDPPARRTLDFDPHEVERAWRDYPAEWKRPRFAQVPHEVDWLQLYHMRKQRQATEVVCRANGRGAAMNR